MAKDHSLNDVVGGQKITTTGLCSDGGVMNNHKRGLVNNVTILESKV